MATRFTDYDMMMALLRAYSQSPRSLHIGNVVGAAYQRGDLAGQLGQEGNLEPEEIAQAMACARELVNASLLLPTYNDLAAPDKWMVITDDGRGALARGALDDLDAALALLSPRFVEIRRGAWRACRSNLPDSLRQAAHSGRELVSQVLSVSSPDDEVKQQTWYNPAKPGLVTRRDRYKNAIRKRKRGWSESDFEIAVKAEDLLEAQHKKLSASAHTREPIDRGSVIEALTTVDMILRHMLV